MHLGLRPLTLPATVQSEPSSMALAEHTPLALQDVYSKVALQGVSFPTVQLVPELLYDPGTHFLVSVSQ